MYKKQKTQQFAYATVAICVGVLASYFCIIILRPLNETLIHSMVLGVNMGCICLAYVLAKLSLSKYSNFKITQVIDVIGGLSIIVLIIASIVVFLLQQEQRNLWVSWLFAFNTSVLFYAETWFIFLFIKLSPKFYQPSKF